jgi:CRP/FNR family transcriptional regulator, anaerobic regulatory protein
MRGLGQCSGLEEQRCRSRRLQRVILRYSAKPSAKRHGGFCGTLSVKQLAKLRAIARRRLVPEGVPLYRAGDAADSYASVVRDVVKLTRTTADGLHHVVALIYPPEFLGYSQENEHRYSATAAIDAELCSDPRAAFHRLLQDEHELCQWLLEYTARQLEFARDWSLMVVCKSSYERVAGFFLLIAKDVKNSARVAEGEPGFIIRLPLPRTELAQYLGLTAEILSRNLTRLKCKELIQFRTLRSIIIPDIRQLAAELDSMT